MKLVVEDEAAQVGRAGHGACRPWRNALTSVSNFGESVKILGRLVASDSSFNENLAGARWSI